jgi:uncharacterized membrane protein required for colicin V production
MEAIINLIIVGLVLGLTYALTSEGLWGAALMFFNVVFAGMIAFNFYEPLAQLLDRSGLTWGFNECLCLLVLFGVSVVALRLTTETLAPAMVRFPMPIYHAGRLVFGLAGACVTMAILILAFDTAPVHKKVFKAYAYDSHPPFGAGFDHHWLGFFQHETGAVFVQYNKGKPDPYHEYGMSGGQGHSINLFDPKGEWLINHQNWRPYGTETIPPPEEETKAEGTEGDAGQQGGGGGPGGRRGPM